MVSLTVTAIGYLVGRNSAEDVYEQLKGHGYLSDRAQSDRAAVISLIDETRAAYPDHAPPGREVWRDVDQALEREGYLSPRGLSEGRRAVTRDGRDA
jgi:hypothetical protein